MLGTVNLNGQSCFPKMELSVDKFKPEEEETLCLLCGWGLWHLQVLSFPQRRHPEPRGFLLARGYLRLLAMQGALRETQTVSKWAVLSCRLPA